MQYFTLSPKTYRDDTRILMLFSHKCGTTGQVSYSDIGSTDRRFSMLRKATEGTRMRVCIGPVNARKSTRGWVGGFVLRRFRGLAGVGVLEDGTILRIPENRTVSVLAIFDSHARAHIIIFAHYALFIVN